MKCKMASQIQEVPHSKSTYHWFNPSDVQAIIETVSLIYINKIVVQALQYKIRFCQGETFFNRKVPSCMLCTLKAASFFCSNFGSVDKRIIKSVINLTMKYKLRSPPKYWAWSRNIGRGLAKALQTLFLLGRR